MKWILVGLAVAMAANANALDYPTMQQFYADPVNADKYAALHASGQLAKQSEVYSKGCMMGAKTETDRKLCECATEYVKAIPEKEMFYESYIAITVFQDTVAARKSGDAELEAELKKFSAERPGLGKKIEAACKG